MALSASTVWEVRTTGSDNSGGGFVAGASGTDRSQQDAAQATGTNLTVDASTNTDVAPDGYAPGATDVGNIIQITAGAGFTTGFYEITSIQSGKWRLDRSPAATSTSGGTWALGGALLTVGKALGAMTVAEQLCYVKAGTYNISAALSTAVNGALYYQSRVVGYNATRGDEPTGASRPVIATNNNAINALNLANQGWEFRNLIFDGSGSPSGLIGVNRTGAYTRLINLKILNFATRGIGLGSQDAFHLSGSEITGCAEGIRGPAQYVSLYGNWIHDNTGPGVIWNGNFFGVTVVRNLFTNNTGASSDGLDIGTNPLGYLIANNVFHGNGRDGLRATAAYFQLGGAIVNNLCTGNGGYGMNMSAGRSATAYAMVDYNAFRTNTSGTYNTIAVGTHDVILSADPYTNAASNDFSLNTTTGGGAACLDAGIPGTFPGALTTGYLDIGAAQHFCPAKFLLVRP